MLRDEQKSLVRMALVLLLLVAPTLFPAMSPTMGQAWAESAGEASFLRTELQVLGADASTSWQAQTKRGSLGHYQIGGQGGIRSSDEFGTKEIKSPDEVSGPSNTGEKVKAGLFSAILPGAGQYHTGHKGKAYIMGGVEVAIWTAYLVFDKQGSNKREDAEQWAGIYAGTSGSHADRYWQDVGHHANSDDFNEALLREARALGESPSGLITGADTWQWVNEERRFGYSRLRADGNSAYDRRDFMILFAVLNRAVSVVDAVIGAGGDDGVLKGEVMGMNMEMEVLPSFTDPGARCVVSRSF